MLKQNGLSTIQKSKVFYLVGSPDIRSGEVARQTTKGATQMTKETKKERARKQVLKCRQMVPNRGIYGNFGFHKCGRPVKGRLADGECACGVHLRAEQVREQNKGSE